MQVQDALLGFAVGGLYLELALDEQLVHVLLLAGGALGFVASAIDAVRLLAEALSHLAHHSTLLLLKEFILSELLKLLVKLLLLLMLVLHLLLDLLIGVVLLAFGTTADRELASIS